MVDPTTKDNGPSLVPASKGPIGAHPKNGDIRSEYPSHAVAVVGMAGRFPGAKSVDALWDLLEAGKSTVEPAPTERIGLGHLPPDDSSRMWWGNFLDDVDAFDHKFFRITAREAQTWDPQQRIMLEVAYEALEDGGQLGASLSSRNRDFGCYIGAVMNNYYDNVACHKASAYATKGTSRCYISGAVSHFFGWTGPAITLDTACSSSMVAVHTACKAIIAGECSRVIAGGTNVITSPHDYRNLAAAGFLSPTGQCKPFDSDADGYCRAEGVGVVVLKSLATAIEENDRVLGVIVGSAVSQSGNVGHIAVPDTRAQVLLHRKALSIANLSPEEVSYVEAHGTGTKVGDPIEMAGLREVYCSSPRKSPLLVSSMKGNIGHTEATAGVAGLIKVLLMMNRRSIPPQASHKRLSPRIPALHPDIVAIPRDLAPWPGTARAAGVASYGAAGSNAAILVREMSTRHAGGEREGTAQPKIQGEQPLLVSVATRDMLSLRCSEILLWLRKQKDDRSQSLELSDVLFNISIRANHALPYTFCTTVSSMDGLELKLAEVAKESMVSRKIGSAKPTILVLGGQERQYVGLSRQCYQEWQGLRRNLDQCHESLIDMGHGGLYPDIFQTAPLADLKTFHAALFASQYSSAKAWIDSGLKVDAVVGHSFGQLAALCICGVLSLADGLKLVTGRASLIEKHWGSECGAMLSLSAPTRVVDRLLEALEAKIDYAQVACYNGPESHVVVGSEHAIRVLERHMDSRSDLRGSVVAQRLYVTHGFHSVYTEAVQPALEKLASKLEWNAPTIHLETCDIEAPCAVFNHSFVANHMRRPVHFQQAVERLSLRYPESCWISAGRAASFLRLAQKSLRGRGHHSFICLDKVFSEASGSPARAIVELWNQGQPVQYEPFERSQQH